MIEQGFNGNLYLQVFTYCGYQPHGQQGVTAQLKEIVIYTNSFRLKY